jgi:hypothetical protein
LRSARLLTAAPALLLCACGGSLTLPAATSPSITVSASPASPATPAFSAVSASDPTTVLLQWQVVIHGDASSGATVNFINATVRDAESGAVASPSGYVNLTSQDVIAQSGSDRVPPGGTLTVIQHLQAGLPAGDTRATVSIAVQLQDDAGQLVTATTETEIPAGAS